MTDARFPERWLNDRRVLRLSDAAFRLFVCGLAWSVANKTDGYLSDEDLALIPGVNLEAAEALYDAELWWGHMHGAQITVFEETQTSRADLAVLANARRRQRDKKRRQRAKAVPGDVPGHSSGDSTRTGQARPGAKTEGRAPPWLPSEFAPSSRPATQSQARRDSGGTTPTTVGVQAATPLQSLRDHNGSEPDGPDVQQISNRGTSRAQPADRNAREAACPVCGMKQRLRTNGKLARHGPKFTPCRGSGLALTGATP